MAERPAFFARRTSGRMQGQIRCKLTENAAMEGNMLRQDVVPKTVSFGTIVPPAAPLVGTETAVTTRSDPTLIAALALVLFVSVVSGTSPAASV